ncbi:uncharacterized protein LOC143459105 isoform X2 [Clavelina lepadiformis]|uniref:uncharacterized protein LOC143459105 isoform X2 n=1 Tax=Clavelina lepadiformis TaxID=159417 RepID=UPI00404181D8
MIAVLFIFSVVATLSHSDEILTCTRPDLQINALQNPNNSNFTRGFPGRRGPAGLKGEQGSKGEKGDPAHDVDVSQLRERLARLEEQLQDVTSYRPYENCSQIFQQNLSSGFYETASLSRYMRKFEYCDLSDNAKGKGFLTQYIFL